MIHCGDFSDGTAMYSLKRYNDFPDDTAYGNGTMYFDTEGYDTNGLAELQTPFLSFTDCISFDQRRFGRGLCPWTGELLPIQPS